MRTHELTREEANELYVGVIEENDTEIMRELCQTDLFFLLSIACKRKDMNNDWLYARCREVESNPNGHLDLWARDHYKSTIITFGKSIQDILINPDVTIGIFSHTRPIAKGFLSQIKTELETNSFLKSLFPEILYAEPQKESPKWSLDGGIRVKRTTNPKEETVEAWGLVDGQPTSKHFKLRIYDDVVTLESVTTPEQIKKTTSAWEMSQNLGSKGGFERYIGTRYHLYDTYSAMMSRGSVSPRLKPATSDGTLDGDPVLLSRDELDKKRRDMGPYTFGSQMLQNPVADKAMAFKQEWLKFYEKIDHSKMNKYILVDPASKKKKSNDYTVMLVIGLAQDNNFYLIDAVRDRLNLSQRAKKLFDLYREYSPLNVGYEEYGAQADIEHMQFVMEQENFRFNITPLGGSVAKEDRIKRLVPVFEQSRMWIPKKLNFINYEGRSLDFVQLFINDEYLAFPVGVHDDMMDCMARILEPALNTRFPKEKKNQEQQYYDYDPSGTGWMG